MVNIDFNRLAFNQPNQCINEQKNILKIQKILTLNQSNKSKIYLFCVDYKWIGGEDGT